MFATETSAVTYRSAAEINSAMIRVYNNMALAVITSMVISFLVSTSPALMTFFFTGWMKWITMFAPLVAVFGVSIALNLNPPREIAILLLHGFAALMGLSFAIIFKIFTIGSIVNAFLGAAVLFGTMSFYGYFTKKDLTSIGQFCFVGLIAIIIASLINVIMASFFPGVVDNSLIGKVISAISILVFLGLTAYDTQTIREMVSTDSQPAIEVQGALTLYMNFVNIFLSLLNLFGNKEE